MCDAYRITWSKYASRPTSRTWLREPFWPCKRAENRKKTITICWSVPGSSWPRGASALSFTPGGTPFIQPSKGRCLQSRSSSSMRRRSCARCTRPCFITHKEGTIWSRLDRKFKRVWINAFTGKSCSTWFANMPKMLTLNGGRKNSLTRESSEQSHDFTSLGRTSTGTWRSEKIIYPKLIIFSSRRRCFLIGSPRVDNSTRITSSLRNCYARIMPRQRLTSSSSGENTLNEA